MKKFTRIKHWYEEYERRISIGSLLLGFVVDGLTLQRIDALRENLWIAANILLAGICIILLNRGKEGDKRAPSSFVQFWLPNILQFSFGALFGSFFIFYFRSATLTATWPFLFLLLLAMIANEFFQKRYARLAFQLSFLYFSLFSFSIFLVPLVVQRIGPAVFILSGAVSLSALWLYFHALRRLVPEKFIESRTHIWSLVTVIFVVINVLYFMQLIPPIPLSLKDAGIYHSISRNSDGNYVVSEEVRGVERYFDLSTNVHWRTGQPLYAYSSIFSPGSINTDVVHNWQYKNEAGKWVTATRIPLHLSGGRSGGFRTYSNKFSFTPGAWRVDVETIHGHLIGRINFEIVLAETDPPLREEVKE